MKLRDQDELFADETLYRSKPVERAAPRPASSVSPRERMLRDQFDIDRPTWGGAAEEQPIAAGPADVPPIEEAEKLPFYKRIFEHRFFKPAVAADPMKSNGRLYFAIVCFLFALCLVVGKLFKLQVLDHERFSAMAADQYKMAESIPARRGVIT